MRPADEIERLLTGLQDRASTSFDQRTLEAMFSALETSIGETPARSWRDTGRAITHSRITQLAAAAALALAVLLLARHLTGRESPAPPGDRNHSVVQVRDNNQKPPAPALTAREEELKQLARDLDTARELFAAADTKGLLRLLETGQEQTRITVAGYLARLGDESAIPALQRLAEQWKGPIEDNPFRKSIEQIRQTSSRREGVGDEGLAQEQASAAAGRDRRIIVRVSGKATHAPIPDAVVSTFVFGETEGHEATTDEAGMFTLGLTESTPEYVRVTVRAEGYVSQIVELQDLRERSLPKTVRFSLEKGTVIGGVVRDGAGRPVEGASVEVHCQTPSPEQFEQPCNRVSVVLTTDGQGRWRSDAVPAKIDTLSLNVRHPEFADTYFSMPRDLKLEDLRGESAVMILNEGLRVAGHVADATGTPIAGAGLMAGGDRYNGQWTETDATGCFRFEPLTAGPLNGAVLLTVQAPGFAPQRRELPVDADLGSVDFVLQPARLLIGRILDSEDKPVEDVSVSAEDWNGSNTIKWRAQSDPNGRFVWDYPPEDAIEISLYKAGYAHSRCRVVANDREQTFVLARAMKIRGTVTDGRTGEPVSRFKVVPGTWSDHGNRISWSTSDTVTRWFTNGHYSYEFLFGAPAYAVRIEADGYLPQESGLVPANEQGATVDLALTQGEVERGPCGYVFDANACPVAGVHVVWSETVLIYEGRADVQGRVYTTTDKDGYFAFQAVDRQSPLVKTGDRSTPFLAVCDQGIGGASYEDLAQNGFILLKPWARVQGQWRIGSRLAANQELYLSPFYDQALPQAGMDRAKAVTDENGRFVFEKVYPGKFMLYNETYRAEPGETLELLIGGAGRMVKGELVMPVASDVPVRAGLQLVLTNVPVPFDKIPKPPGYIRMSLAEVRAWLTQFDESPEGRAYSTWLTRTDPQNIKYLHVKMDDRSRFHIDNVEPGVYVLKGEVNSGGMYDSRMMAVATGQEHLLAKPVGSVWYEFEVPPLASDGEVDIPFDLGPVPVRPATEPKPGDPASDFDVPAFGPDRIRLADYRGRILLLTFFSDSCFDRYPQGLEELKAVYQRFHQDARYAQVGLLLGGYPLLGKKAIDEAGLDWPHGMVEGYGSREAREYGMPSKMLWNVLIGPQGQILAVDLFTEALQKAVEAALRAAR